MKKNTILILIIFVLTLFSGCSKDNSAIKDETISADVEVDKKIDDADDKNDIDNNETKPDSAPAVEDDKFISKLDGNYYNQNEIDNRPIMVSIDNHPNARQQAGISDAQIVYEIEAEFPYTRYLAIFQSKEPERIGPIRSARPYMLYLALEFNSIFVHVGGSEQALAEIRELKLNDIDGLNTSSMWRCYDTNKYAPHNTYTTLDSIRKDSANRQYSLKDDFEGYIFNTVDKNLSDDYNDSASAEYVNIIYNRENSTEYIYDSEKRLYNRIKDGEKHLDENNNAEVTAKNIIIYEVDREVLDNEGRLYLGVIGNGKGYYITNGERIDITWEKANEYDKTKFYYNNKEINLNSGNTWIQVVTKNATKIEFTNE